MPSTDKTLHYLASVLVTSISVGVLGYSVSIDWAGANMDCAASAGVFNGSAMVTFELFSGNIDRNFCPFGGGELFDVFPRLREIGGPPLILHGLVVCLVVLCFVFSAISILISLYNSVSNPYETYMGPIAIYTCSSLSACLSVLVLIIFVLNFTFTNMAEESIRSSTQAGIEELRKRSSEMRLGYYLVIPYTVCSLLAVGMIYKYDHAAYVHRREQQKPTENAPKEIMMY